MSNKEGGKEGNAMPRIHQLKTEYLDKDFVRAIRIHQAEACLPGLNYIASRTGIPETRFYRRINHPHEFSVEELRRLIPDLRITPEEMLRFLGYSEKDIKKALTT